jgi:hypothetical protein
MTALIADPRPADRAAPAEAPARRTLRMQIARLESELIALPATASADPRRAKSAGAVLPSVEELERTRDELVRRIRERRFTGGEEQERKRRLREEMLLDPAAHFGVTVSNAEVGEPGCTRWSSWFRLRISGGCP